MARLAAVALMCRALEELRAMVRLAWRRAGQKPARCENAQFMQPKKAEDRDSGAQESCFSRMSQPLTQLLA